MVLHATGGTLGAGERPTAQLSPKQPGSWGTDVPDSLCAWLRDDKGGGGVIHSLGSQLVRTEEGQPRGCGEGGTPATGLWAKDLLSSY